MLEKLKDKLKEKFEYWNQDISDEDVLDFAQYSLQEVIEKSDSFKLYRYMPANYFNIRNVETQKIHLSENGIMNDIYEGLPCTEKNISYYKLQKLRDMAVMCCLTETKDNTLMWSHYAEEHGGFCVEYDLKRLKNDYLEIGKHIFPVIYTNKRILHKDMNSLIESHIILREAIEKGYEYDGDAHLDDILPLFLTKGVAWEYEKEWRIIYTKKQQYDMDFDELYNGNIKFQCISAIYLGYRIHPEVKENLIEICKRISTKENPIVVYQETLDKEGYEILFEAIDLGQ